MPDKRSADPASRGDGFRSPLGVSAVRCWMPASAGMTGTDGFSCFFGYLAKTLGLSTP